MCLLGSVIGVLTAEAQNFIESSLAVRQYGTNEGLPSKTVRAIHKDRTGLMWIGTDAGLCTFDGKDFKIISQIPGDKIWSITEDNHGSIWFAIYGSGVGKYRNDSITIFNTTDGLVSNWVREVHFSVRHKLLMIGTEQGLNIMKEGVLLQLKNSEVQPVEIKKITDFEDGGDKIWITSYQNGLFEFYPEKSSIKHRNSIKGTRLLGSSSTLITSKDTLISYGRRGFLQLKAGSQSMQYDTTIGQVFDFEEDESGKIWVASWSFDMYEPGGLFVIDGDQVVNYAKKSGIESTQIWEIYCDSSTGIVWIGSLDHGLYQLLPQYFEFINLLNSRDEQIEAKCILVDDMGTLWIGTDHNLITLTASGEVKSIDLKELEQKILTKMQSLFAQEEKAVLAADRQYYRKRLRNFNILRKDPVGRVWAGFEGGALVLETISNYEFVAELDNKTFDFISQSELLAGGWNSFTRFAIGEDHGIELYALPNLFKDKPRETISQIVHHRGTDWIASWTEGIISVRRDSLVFHNAEKYGLFHNIICIEPGNGDTLFVADSKGKVIALKTLGDKLIKLFEINPDQDFRWNTVQWLRFDPKSYLWIGSNLGLHCLKTGQKIIGNTETLYRFSVQAGLPFSVSYGADFDQQGNLWIIGDHSLVKVMTKKTYQHRPFPLPLSIESASVNDEACFSIPATSDTLIRLLLPYPVRYFQLNLIYKDFYLPDGLRIRYSLSGQGSGWSSWLNDPEIHLGNLGPGRHILEIEGKHSSGLYQKKCLRLELSIPPPWYLHPWTIFLFVLILILIMFIILFQVRRLTRRKERKQTAIRLKIAELETKALQSQMNPHFVFNSLNAIQGYILDEDGERAMQYLSDFSKVVRDSLENVDRKRITLNDEISFLESYLRLEGMRFPGMFEWKFSIDPSLGRNNIQIPPFIIQPYVENAIKHGFRNLDRPGHLSIEFKAKTRENLLIIQVTDNGVGLTYTTGIAAPNADRPDYRRSHSGSITESRIHLMNEEGSERFKVIVDEVFEDGQSAGTKVIIILPLVVLSKPSG